MGNATIASCYNEIAQRWLDDRFSQDDGIGQYQTALRFIQSGVGGWALNVGCGCNTRFNALIRECGMNIEGVDISDRMIALAKDADPAVLLHCVDICQWHPQRTYRFISAWDSIWHVSVKEQPPLMLKLMHALDVGGFFLFTAGGLDHEDAHVNSTMGPEVYYGTLGIPRLLDLIKEAGCVCRHLEFDQLPEKHLYIVVQRVEN